MARIAKLNQAEATKLIKARPHNTISKLSKKFGISESSVYKVLNGTYSVREDGLPAPRRMRRRSRQLPTSTVAHSLHQTQPTTLPAAPRPTPSLFHAEAPAAPRTAGRRRTDAQLDNLLQHYRLTPGDLDPVSLAAAEVLAARARFAQALRTSACEIPH